MTRKAKILLGLAVALGAIYLVFFTDLFRTQSIQIAAQIRPGRASAIPRPRDSVPVYPVSFRFDQRYKFTSIKVVNAAQYATNKFAPPLWHVVSDSSSAPQNSVVYGFSKIPGMRAAVAKAKPQPLEADVPYLIIVEAGKAKGQTNFVTREYVPSRTR
jgi:hypothetical protein